MTAERQRRFRLRRYFLPKLSLLHCIITAYNLLLGLLRQMLFKSNSNADPRTILVYRTARLGDFIVSLPAFAALRRRFPFARIVLLTTASTIPAMRHATAAYAESNGNLPWLSLVVPELVNEAITFSGLKWKSELRQIRLRLEEFQPEATIMLPFSGEGATNRAKKLLFLRCMGVRGPVYGWRVHSTTGFMRDLQYEAGFYEHQVWGPLRAVMELPLMPVLGEKDIVYPMTIEDETEIWVHEEWARLGWETKKVVAIFPGGMFPHKCWPVEKFIELCLAMRADTGMVFAVIGSGSDRTVCGRLCEALEPGTFLNLAGQTTVSKLAALFRRCVLSIGNDSGPMHLASAAGCPCITITSSIEYPGWWEPWNSRDNSIRHSVPCQYCFSYLKCPLGTNECIESIEVTKALDKVHSVLGSTDRSEPTISGKIGTV